MLPVAAAPRSTQPAAPPSSLPGDMPDTLGRLQTVGAKVYWTDLAGTVTIASGTTTGDITWKSDNVWNNDGDTAYLYDGSGRLISQKKG